MARRTVNAASPSRELDVANRVDVSLSIRLELGCVREKTIQPWIDKELSLIAVFHPRLGHAASRID